MNDSMVAAWLVAASSFAVMWRLDLTAGAVVAAGILLAAVAMAGRATRFRLAPATVAVLGLAAVLSIRALV